MADVRESSFSDEVRAAFVDEAAELLQRVEVALNALSSCQEGARRPLWLDVLRALHTLKGAAGAVGDEDIKREVHALEDRVRALAETGEAFSASAREALHLGLERIHAAIGGAAAPPQSAREEAGAAAPDALIEAEKRAALGDVLRVKPEKVDALHMLVGELIVARLQHEAIVARVLALRDDSTEALAVYRRLGVQIDRARPSLPAATWDEMSAAARSVASMMASVAQEIAAVARDLPLIEAHAASVGASIEESVRDLRLMPLHPFFEEYTKVVREAARECGKEARLGISAGGAEIDRAVLARLREPLLHLVRNAVVHGIEGPGQRREAGKSPVGVVRLEARCEGTRAVLRVIDDGKGVDVERVRQKAIEARILEPGAMVGDDDLLGLLTHPGFSTRDAADGLAGRGIGLDVVAGTVRDLDGSLRLDTIPGAGSVFTIEVPITASTVGGLVLSVGDHLLGILLNHVERVIRFGLDEVTPIRGRDTVVVDGDPVGVVMLADLLGIDAPAPALGKRPAIVLRMGKQRLVIVVNDIPEQQALIVRPLGRAFSSARLFLGGAIQPDGSVLPILQVASLFERAGAVRAGAHSSAVTAPARQASSVSILVVDDSFTMRTLLRNILQAARYAVSVAHDGVSALETLSQMSACDLIITDLQMPRMDGTELCRVIRRSDRSKVPIIVVTSVGDPQEKRRAIEAGADTFIVKSDFEQAYFLELVGKLTGAVSRAA